MKNEEGRGMSLKSSRSHNVNKKVWKGIWKIPVPKVKNFIWKTFKNILTTNENLWKKRIRKSAICLICEKQVEIVEHMLL